MARPIKETPILFGEDAKRFLKAMEDVVKVGDKVKVKTIKIDERGRVDMKLIKKL